MEPIYRVRRLSYRVYLVEKETEDDITVYYVRFDEKGWKCTCMGSIRGYECKHVRMVKESLRKDLKKS